MPKPVIASPLIAFVLGLYPGLFIGADCYCYGPQDGDPGCGFACWFVACFVGCPAAAAFALIALAEGRRPRIHDPAASPRGHWLQIIIAGAFGTLAGFFSWPVFDWPNVLLAPLIFE